MFGPDRTATGRFSDERREPASRRRVETLCEAQDRRVAREVLDHLAEGPARHGDDDKLGVVDHPVVALAPEDLDVVPAVAEHAAEDGAPRACADDGDLHVRLTKSMDTGIPCRSKRSRTLFSTQYP